jgi:hypothetical protein
MPQVRSGWYPPLLKRAARPGGEFFNSLSRLARKRRPHISSRRFPGSTRAPWRRSSRYTNGAQVSGPQEGGNGLLQVPVQTEGTDGTRLLDNPHGTGGCRLWLDLKGNERCGSRRNAPCTSCCWDL